ncbi:helix-hairpin-helix domain-containing protein [Permianibacter sp. IMCC34836]|uniref:ComEA family DNA-binding protein n=1 Tax=Permianibacter fluminis TaxID=2738515 RepID=UPI0015558E21|nr:helix-hairpin-helix domain-containing protein [Permianibacter fluminis]NQD37397.1 helix-hairpin-helix domain-containing protein [Permianibacter fluminis]
MRYLIAAASLALLTLIAPAHANPSTGKPTEVVSADAKTADAKVESRLNINTASAKELAKGMKGIGIKKAEAIVAHREANGPFKAVEDLLKVKGVGPATLQKNAARIAIK